MPLDGHNFIAGQTPPSTGRAWAAVSPAKGTTLPTTFRAATEPDVAVALAAASADLATFRSTVGAKRAELLEAAAEAGLAAGDEQLRRANQETGLSPERLTGARTRTVSQLGLFAHVAREGWWVDARLDRADPDRTPLPKPGLRRLLQPPGLWRRVDGQLTRDPR